MKNFSTTLAALILSLLCCAEAWGADIPNNEIHYTASEKVTPNSSDIFGANIVSNTFADGKGTIIFDGEVTKIGQNAFHDCSALVSITLPNNIQIIGYNAFQGCTSLTSINFPNSLIIIGAEAFLSCESLTSIIIPESVTNIVSKAFRNCSGLTDITVNWSYPSSVTLDSYIFEDLTPSNITLHVPVGTGELYRNAPIWKEFNIADPNYIITYTASEKITPYDENAFNVGIVSNKWDSESGKGTIVFDEDVTSIGEKAFYNCLSLASITLPDSVTSIGKYAFWGCSSLTSINIPESVTSIGEKAFFKNSSLASINIPESVTSIGDSAFYECKNLTSITVNWNNPSSVTLGKDVFKSLTLSNTIIHVPYGTVELYRNAPIWKEFNIADPNYIITYTASEKVTPNSSDVFGANIVSNTFADGKGTIIFDGEVTRIGQNAFSDCSALVSITLPNNIKIIGYNAFQGCTSLTSINIPESVTSIEEYAFYNCSALASINIPESVTSIGNYAFNGCSSLTSINIPESVTSIGDDAFYYCSALNSITVNWSNPSSVTLGSNIFEGLTPSNITLHVPFGTAELYRKAPVWKEFNIVERNNVIFYTASKEVTLVTLDADAFNVGIKSSEWDSKSKKGTITFDGDVTSIGKKAFSYKFALTSITLPESVTSIGSEAFYYCMTLKSINIPEGVTSIESKTFENCSALTDINIPDDVTSIGDNAFGDCSSLTDITVNWNTPSSVTLGSNIFNGLTTSNITLHVPYGTAELYQAIDTWKDLNIVEQTNPNRVIYYTSSKEVNPTGTFIVGIVSNEWDSESGKGIITFDGDVTSIGIAAFNNCSKLTGITLPKSVTSIGENAFVGCSSLKSINIPEGVTSIGRAAFNNCSKLTSITLPKSVTSIEEGAFSSCSSLTDINIPSKVSCIKYGVFSDCKKLKSINIPESVTSIEEDAFCRCESLTDVTVNWENPSSVSINDFAFDYTTTSNITLHVPAGTSELYQAIDIWKEFKIAEPCNAICYTASEKVEPTETFNVGIVSNEWNSKSGKGIITFDGDVTSIGEIAFLDCESLTGITLPATVTNIGDGAFKNCSSLQSINIPEGVTSIGSAAFYYCNSLDSINIPESVTSIGNAAFYYCTSLKSINIPEGVTSIESMTFENCSALTDINIPENVDSIQWKAFLDCENLKSINIPKSVTFIGDYAFQRCKSFTDVTVNWENPLSATLSENTFQDVTVSEVILYVPAGTGKLYRNAPVWKEFKIIEKTIPLNECKEKALAELAELVSGYTHVEAIKTIYDNYVSLINAAESNEEVYSIKQEGINKLTTAIDCYKAGIETALSTLPTEGETGNGVRVILEVSGQDDKVFEFMNPTQVQFFKK